MKELVYITEYLGKTLRGKHILRELKSILGDSLKIIPDSLNAKNEWCRDYMPVRASDGTNVLFRYMPSYLLGSPKEEAKIPDQLRLCNDLGIKVRDGKIQDIILDGGAIEILGQKGIISDRVFNDNHVAWNMGIPDIYKQIKDLLNLKELIVIPANPSDFKGHINGLLRFIDEDRVLVNDLSGMDDMMESDFEQEVVDLWIKNLNSSLKNSGLKIEKLPCLVHDNEDDESAEGIYMNFLLLQDNIFMPSYEGKNKTNEEAKSILEKLYGLPVHDIEATELAMKGGIINSVTWLS